MADTIENPVHSGYPFFDIPLKLIRLTWGLKQMPLKNDSNISLYAIFKQRSGCWSIKFNQIGVWKSLTMDMLLLYFQGNCFKPHANRISINRNIKESLTWIKGVREVLILLSHVILCCEYRGNELSVLWDCGKRTSTTNHETPHQQS